MGGRKVVRRFSNARLEAVRIALFPDPTKNEDGSHTLHDADENLSAALYDLKRTKADATCIKTVTRVLHQLHAAREAMCVGRWGHGERTEMEHPASKTAESFG